MTDKPTIVLCVAIGILIGFLATYTLWQFDEQRNDEKVNYLEISLDSALDIKDECMIELEYEEWKTEYMIDQYEIIGSEYVSIVSALMFLDEDWNLSVWGMSMDNETLSNRTKHIENIKNEFNNETNDLFRNETVWRERYDR